MSISNEELQMTALALQGGWQVAYLPQALVAHNVAPERLKPSWFLNRGWWQGISECYREQVAGEADINQLLRGIETKSIIVKFVVNTVYFLRIAKLKNISYLGCISELKPGNTDQ